MVTCIDPQCIAHPSDVLHQSFRIGHHAVDTAAVARHNQRHMLARHLRTIIKQVRLHDGRHLAPPQGRDDDDVLVLREVGNAYRIDGRIARCIVGRSLDSIQQRRADGIAVCLVLLRFVRRLYAHHIRLNLTRQRGHYLVTIVRVTVVHHQRLACLLHGGGLHFVVL